MMILPLPPFSIFSVVPSRSKTVGVDLHVDDPTDTTLKSGTQAGRQVKQSKRRVSNTGNGNCNVAVMWESPDVMPRLPTRGSSRKVISK
ncbi:hypothetical protein VTH06DRAFT_2163 [Thermothelomyces fergusii]